MCIRDSVNSDLIIKDIDFDYVEEPEFSVDFMLYQNTPNPFTDQTTIYFDIPLSGEIKFTVYDLNGKVHFLREGYFNQGKNQINITTDELNQTGIFYYKLEIGQYTDTRKLIFIGK